MMNLLRLATVFAVSVFVVTGDVRGQDPQLRFGNQVPPEVEVIYDRGLSWLVQHQGADGSWNEGQAGHSHGAGGPGTTGMCIMAFLASGEDPNFGRYRDNIRKAVASMIRGQSESTGYLGGSMYHHGFGMLGLSEVYGVLDEDDLWTGESATGQRRSIGEALELAIRCAATSQKNNQWGGWRYSPEARDADTSVSGAVLMGLLAARNAGLKVPDECIDKALDYFKQMTSSRGGVGYSGGVGGMGGSQNLKAIAALVYAVGKRRELAEYQGVLEQLTTNLEHQESSYPCYFRYYNAQALFQGDFEAWNKWNTKTIRQLKDLQNQDGSFASNHGQPYGTAMSLLALALNYRFLPIYER
ncbi:MAG: squalene--hopene cyclase [Planctomycetaceae bacterium]